jgi:hypothetical protein
MCESDRYSDGEKGDAAKPVAFRNAANLRNRLRCVFLPVTIRGEMPGRAMRGGAD